MTQATYKLEDLKNRQIENGNAYLEFLRVPSMSCGIYVLSRGDMDRQSEHAQDEIYYVVSGDAQITLDEAGAAKDHPVGRGDVIFVHAGQKHQFHSITEELTLLVA